nr:hypothetical protein [Candidatus Sigynarchaeota archaeon]
TISRVLGWFVVFVQAIIPVYGWFYGTVLGRDLWVSGRGIKEQKSRAEFIKGLVIAVATVAISDVVIVAISA